MKTITCLDCDHKFSGNTAEEVMEAMMPHYLKDHKDVLDADTQEQRDGWFSEFNRRFDTALEE